MIVINKNIYTYFIGFLIIISNFFLINNCFGQDLMEQAFKEAMNHQTVIDVGNTKNAVGNTLLRETMTIEMNENLGQGCFLDGQFQNVNENKCKEIGGDWKIRAIDISARAPLIVRITKFLLRMTIVLSITMIIFNSIKYMIEILSGKDRKSTESMKNLIFIAVGIILALMSVSIINLIISVPKSSLKTSDDLSAFQIGCKTGTTILAGNELKKRICENSTFGDPIDVLSYRIWKSNKLSNKKCRFPDKNIFYSGEINGDPEKKGERKAITREDMKSKCIEDIGGEVIK